MSEKSGSMLKCSTLSHVLVPIPFDTIHSGVPESLAAGHWLFSDQLKGIYDGRPAFPCCLEPHTGVDVFPLFWRKVWFISR